jgi:hypothetical protein
MGRSRFLEGCAKVLVMVLSLIKIVDKDLSNIPFFRLGDLGLDQNRANKLLLL